MHTTIYYTLPTLYLSLSPTPQLISYKYLAHALMHAVVAIRYMPLYKWNTKTFAFGWKTEPQKIIIDKSHFRIVNIRYDISAYVSTIQVESGTKYYHDQDGRSE